MNYSLEGKDIVFTLYTDSTSVEEGDNIQVTLTASGKDAVPGLEIPYSIIGTVRSADIKTQTMFGTFKLDSSLSCLLNIKINNDPYVESSITTINKPITNSLPITIIYPTLSLPNNTEDVLLQLETLTIGLYYKPSVYLDITIKDKTNIETDNRITSDISKPPLFTITPLSKTVKEGNPIIFLVKYYNVIDGFKFSYTAYDTITQLSDKGYFYTDDTGYAYITLQTKVTNTTSRPISITLDRYPEVNTSVQVNTARAVSYLDPIVGARKVVDPLKDTTITIPYGRSLKFHIIGSGGAGGDVAKSGGTDGYSGIASYIYNTTYGTFKANGGQGGRNNGTGGAGGVVEIVEPLDGSITYQIIESNSGNTTDVFPGIVTQPGGASVAANAYTTDDGTGGIGSKGSLIKQRQISIKRWYGHKRYTEDYQEDVYGRGGGSGSYLCVVLTNNSNMDITFTLNVGTMGLNVANSDLNGKNGSIIIEDAQ